MEEARKYVFMKGEVDFGQSICQYMDLDYVIKLLESKKYYVKSKSEFKDLYESKFPVKDMFPVYQANIEVDKETLISDLNKFKEKSKLFTESTRFFTACWTMLDRENALMWKSYTSKFGACIKTTLGKLLDSLKTADYDVCCAKVSYGKYSYYNDNMLFNKINAYADERELRFYFIPKQNPESVSSESINIDVDTETMISEIILSPYIDPAASKVLCKFLHENYNVNVNTSIIKERI